MNVPNTLTVIRLLLIPVFVVAMLVELPAAWRWLPLAILIVSGLTDVADGYIARRFNQVTQLGKILDPLADKLSLFALTFCIAANYPPLWIVAGVLVIKEVLQILGGGYLMKKHIKIPSSRWPGKLCTAVTYACFVLLLFLPAVRVEVPQTLVWGMVLVILALMILAFFTYLPVFFGLLRENKSFDVQNPDQSPRE